MSPSTPSLAFLSGCTSVGSEYWASYLVAGHRVFAGRIPVQLRSYSAALWVLHAVIRLRESVRMTLVEGVQTD
jgi:hypothetical protein